MSKALIELRDYIRGMKDASELRDLGTVSNGAGGVLVAPEGKKNLLRAAKTNYFAVRMANPVPTKNGAGLTVPFADDTSGAGEIVTEGNTTTTDTATPFPACGLSSFLYSSKLFKVSKALLQDAPNPEEIVLALGGDRVSRLLDAHIVAGTGTGQPAGIIGAASLGKTGTIGQTSSIIAQDFLDVLASMDEGYWDAERMTWLMARATFGAALKLLHPAGGAPLVQYDAQGVPRILGFKVGIDPNVPTMAANAKSVLLVNWDYVLLREVENSLTLQAFHERFADSLQVGFLVDARYDAKLATAGAARYYANSAT